MTRQEERARDRGYYPDNAWYARQTKALARLKAWRSRQSIWPAHKFASPTRMGGNNATTTA